MQTIRHLSTTGLTVYAYPLDQSLADWTTHRIQLTEDADPNEGRYTGSVDGNNDYAIFESGDQPDDWGQAAAVLSFGPTVDGVNYVSFLEAVLAYVAAAKTVVTDNENGTFTLDIYKQDGTTIKTRITFNSNGEWTSTELDPA